MVFGICGEVRSNLNLFFTSTPNFEREVAMRVHGARVQATLLGIGLAGPSRRVEDEPLMTGGTGKGR
jgi:hypothetical protein